MSNEKRNQFRAALVGFRICVAKAARATTNRQQNLAAAEQEEALILHLFDELQVQLFNIQSLLTVAECDTDRIEWLEAHAWKSIDGNGNMLYNVPAFGGEGVRAAIDRMMEYFSTKRQ